MNSFPARKSVFLLATLQNLRVGGKDCQRSYKGPSRKNQPEQLGQAGTEGQGS